MKESKENIDVLIREALGQEEAEIFERLGEPSLPEMLSDLFRGRQRFLAIGSIIIMTILFGFGIYCAVRFFQAAEVRGMLLWGWLFFFCLFATGAIKLWHWMEIEKNAVLREVKRLELQVAYLASEIRGGRNP